MHDLPFSEHGEHVNSTPSKASIPFPRFGLIYSLQFVHHIESFYSYSEALMIVYLDPSIMRNLHINNSRYIHIYRRLYIHASTNHTTNDGE
jgi:hypothetical protein